MSLGIRLIQGAASNRRVSVDPRSDRILNSGAIGKTVNSCMVARDTRYLPFPKEGIEAFKRRTLDTTRHLTCSGAHSRKPLSWVSYLFSLSVSHPQHTVSFYPSSSAPATTLPLFGLPSSLFSLFSLSHAAICLWFKTSGHLLHCLLTHTLERLRDGGTVLRSSRR